jgi:hypothetical protein
MCEFVKKMIPNIIQKESEVTYSSSVIASVQRCIAYTMQLASISGTCFYYSNADRNRTAG